MLYNAGTRLPSGEKIPLIQHNDLDLTLHLLKRTLLGVSYADILHFKDKQLGPVIEELINPPLELLDFPVKDYSAVNATTPDLRIAQGETWINDYNIDKTINAKRKHSLKTWLTGRLVNTKGGMKPRMFLFWSEYFSIEINKIAEAAKAYRYYQLIHDHSMENYKDMLSEIILDRTNNLYFRKKNKGKVKSRETYARFMLSRYIMGEQYAKIISTEKIKKLSRLIGEWDRIYDELSVSLKQDTSAETNILPAVRDKAVVKAFTNELSEYFHSLLQYPPAATYPVKKLYHYLLSGNIDAEAEKYIIQPVSREFQIGKFDIKRLLRALLLNEQFYQRRYQANYIKSPATFMTGLWKEFMVYTDPQPQTVVDHYPAWDWLKNNLIHLGQDIGDTDLQESYLDNAQMYYRQQWLTDSSVQYRNTMIERLLHAGFQVGGTVLTIDTFKFAQTLSNPADPDQLINDSLTLLYRVPLNDNIPAYLKRNFLLDGEDQNDIWTKKWNAAMTNSSTSAEMHAVVTCLRKLYRFLLTQPEYLYI